jgi:hypothetical protein
VLARSDHTEDQIHESLPSLRVLVLGRPGLLSGNGVRLLLHHPSESVGLITMGGVPCVSQERSLGVEHSAAGARL